MPSITTHHMKGQMASATQFPAMHFAVRLTSVSFVVVLLLAILIHRSG